mgnify:FL=1
MANPDKFVYGFPGIRLSAEAVAEWKRDEPDGGVAKITRHFREAMRCWAYSLCLMEWPKPETT